MKTGKIIWGLILVFTGCILLLDNFGVIDFYWQVIWHYWPVLLILSGVNMLFSRSNSTAAAFIPILTTCILLGFIGYVGITHRSLHEGRWYKDDIASDENHQTENTFTEEFSPGTQRAELNILGGSASYKLEGSTPNLFVARVKRTSGHYLLKKISRDSMEVLNFRMAERNGPWDIDENEVRLRLNELPVWNININIGAGETDFDLSRFKIKDLRFEGGAASFRIKLGELQPITNVKVKSGIADINILVPSSAGCLIRVDSGLSSRDFDGFTKQTNGTYTTPAFDSASKKIIIDLHGGLSNFEVRRY